MAPALVNKYILSLHHTLRDKYYAKVRREAAKADGNGSSGSQGQGPVKAADHPGAAWDRVGSLPSSCCIPICAAMAAGNASSAVEAPMLMESAEPRPQACVACTDVNVVGNVHRRQRY